MATLTPSASSILEATRRLVGLSSTSRARRPSSTGGPSSSAASALGSAMGAESSSQKVEPSPSRLTKPTPPSISSARRRVMASPRPEPPKRREVEPSACWNRRNRAAWAASGMPMPVSSISKRRRRSAPCSCDDSRTSTWPSEVNLMALPIRLNSPWRSRTGSAWIQTASSSLQARN